MALSITLHKIDISLSLLLVLSLLLQFSIDIHILSKKVLFVIFLAFSSRKKRKSGTSFKKCFY